MTSGIVDTGASILVGSKILVSKMKLAAGLPLIGNNVDCTKINTFKSFTFTIDTTDYKIDPYDYII